jgi:deoxycytidylate deaminase
MTNYLRSAISAIYSEGDDFVLLGLTGRTGSGCSTVAGILQSNLDAIKHSLFSGDSPISNEQRKEKIVRRYFENSWEPFCRIQVRSVLTLMLAECELEKALSYLRQLRILADDGQINSLQDTLCEILRRHRILETNSSQDAVESFYARELPSLCEELRSKLGESAFVRLYQQIGTNVRMSGNPIVKELNEGQFFALAERINDIVKKIREECRQDKRNTFLVIDAIRSPLEAIFFQERYAAFSLVAVSCSDEDRKSRLRKLGYTESDIALLDDQEYQDRDLDKESTYSIQDIQACLQRADIYVSNPNEPNAVSEFRTLGNQIVRFVSLMRRPGLVTPTPVERCMQIAYTAKLNSGCISRQVGAIITDRNFSVQAIGWNDTAHGQVPCNLRNRFDLVAGKDQIAYSHFEKSDPEYLPFFSDRSCCYRFLLDDGRNPSYCFKSEYNKHKNRDNQVHTRSLHAEENAFRLMRPSV